MSEPLECINAAIAAITTTCDTPNEVAAFLLARDCKGERSSPSYCPLANYFKKQCNEQHVSVGSMIKVWRHGEPLGVQTPQLLADFFSAFDQGRFSELRGDALDA